MHPIELVFPPLRLFHIRAVTLFPFILYASVEDRKDMPLVLHEHYHWRDQLRWGILPWFLAYLVLQVFYWGRPAPGAPYGTGSLSVAEGG